MHSNSIKLTAIIIATLGCYMSSFAQDKIYFEGDGTVTFRSTQIIESGSEKEPHISFYLKNPEPEFIYFIGYDFYEKPIFSNTIIEGSSAISFKDGVAKIQFSKKSNFLNFQLYKVPSKIWDEVEASSMAILRDNLGKKSTKLLELTRSDLINYINQIPYDSASLIMTNLGQYNDKDDERIGIEGQLSKLLASKDSLTLADQLEYNKFLELKKVLKRKIDQYQSLLETTIKAKNDVSKDLLNDFKEANKAYLENLDEIGKLDIKKRNYKKEESKKLTDQIEKIKIDQVALLKSGLRKIVHLLGLVNKTYTYNLELLYAGSVSTDNKIKWVDYDTNVSKENGIVGFSRISGPLPVMDEFDYLGVSIHNIPMSKIKNATDFKITFETDRSTEIIDRFGGVRTVLSSEEQNVRAFVPDDRFKFMWESANIDKSKSPPTFDCSKLKTSRLGELMLKWKQIKEGCTDAATAPLVNAIEPAIHEYIKLIERISKMGKAIVNPSTDKTLVDYNLVTGARFTQNIIPIIKINGKEKDKTTPAPIYVNDRLEPVVKKYWFGLSTGLMATVIPNYRYYTTTVPQTQERKVVEERYLDYKIYPSIFMSVYFTGQRIDRKPTFCNSLSINLGVDYVTLLDNAYLGLGFEPVRHLQVNGGFRFGKVKKLNYDVYDPTTLNYQAALKDQWLVGYYLGINLYLNVIPVAIKSVFGKKVSAK